MKFKTIQSERELQHTDDHGDTLHVMVINDRVYIWTNNAMCVSLSEREFNKIVRKTRNEIEDQTQ